MNNPSLKDSLSNCFSYVNSFVDYDENRSYCNCDDDYCKCTTVNPILNSVNYKVIIENIGYHIKTSQLPAGLACGLVTPPSIIISDS